MNKPFEELLSTLTPMNQILLSKENLSASNLDTIVTGEEESLLINIFVKQDYTVQHAYELIRAIKEYYIRKSKYSLRYEENEA
jgi:hypothetical protein